MRDVTNQREGIAGNSWLAVLVVAVLVGGCASAVKPSDLSVPARLTCLYLPEPLRFSVEKGLLNVTWITRLERGAYVSEREDEGGTFYRAPPGGVFVGLKHMANSAPNPMTNGTVEGGVYVPRDASVAPRVYTYFSTETAVPQVPPAGQDCSLVVAVRDPAGKSVDLVHFAVGGAIGGAAGGALSSHFGNSGGMGYGQSAAVGAVGGAVGGLIVASLINMDVGKIFHREPITDSAALSALRSAISNQLPVEEVRDRKSLRAN